MEAKEIIQKPQEVYDKFKVPPNLRQHMLLVAGVAKVICDNWQGPEIDKDSIVAACLVHDLGNILKMDMDSEEQLELEPSLERNPGLWKSIQNDIARKYGDHHHEATMKMLDELNVNDRIMYILNNSELEDIDKVTSTNDYALKIKMQSDHRVAPDGVVSREERFREAEERYKEFVEENPEKHARIKQASKDIERQIFNHLPFSPGYITQEKVEEVVEESFNKFL